MDLIAESPPCCTNAKPVATISTGLYCQNRTIFSLVMDPGIHAYGLPTVASFSIEFGAKIKDKGSTCVTNALLAEELCQNSSTEATLWWNYTKVTNSKQRLGSFLRRFYGFLLLFSVCYTLMCHFITVPSNLHVVLQHGLWASKAHDSKAETGGRNDPTV